MIHTFKRWFLLGAIFCFSCADRNRNRVKPIVDSVETDTLTFPYHPQDSAGQALELQNLRDSFYAIPVVKTYASIGGRKAFHQLVADFLDTSAVIDRPGESIIKSLDSPGWEEDTIWRHDKNKIGEFIVEVKESYSGEELSKLLINGKEQRPDRELDTSLVWEAFIYSFNLHPEESKVLRIGGQKYLYLTGSVSSCSGLACSVTFHLIYNPVINKSFVVHQFRMDEFYIGFNKKNKELEFILWDDFMYNDPLEYMPCSGMVYRFTDEGKVLPVKTVTGEPAGFRGYSINNFDKIHLTHSTR
jgi:hypothetical protein